MIYDNAAQAAPAIAERIASADRILLLTHINPDGDAIGSLLGLWHTLRSLGKQAFPIASSPLPSYSNWLPGAEHIQVYQHDNSLPDVDLVMLVDTASLGRAGRVYDEHTATLGELPIVVIDHHVTNGGGGDVNLIRPASASACELLYRLFQAMHITITPEMATCLLLGLTTDTQSFQTSATKAESLHIAAELIDHGADHARIVHEVYYALPSSSALLIGKAIAEMRRDGPIAWTVISQAMSRATGAEDEAADEVVRMMQRIQGVRALVMFKERQDGTTKISLRSKPPINVAALAQVWGGGGHAQAAGATLLMTPAQAEREVLPRLREVIEKF